MSFGKRITAPREHLKDEPSAVVARRGGYPLGVLSVAVSSYLCTLLMTFIPYFNPTSRTLGEIAGTSIMAVLNVAVVAAIVLILVDLLFRALKVSAVWAYAFVGGVLTFGVWFLLASALGSGAVSPAFVSMMVFLPAAIGGSVLGLFRTRA